MVTGDRMDSKLMLVQKDTAWRRFTMLFYLGHDNKVCYTPNCTRHTYSTPERSDSGVELRTLDYENPGSNPGCGVKSLGKFFHSTLLQFTQLNKNEYLAIDSGGYVYEQPSHINCSKWLDASQRS